MHDRVPTHSDNTLGDICWEKSKRMEPPTVFNWAVVLLLSSYTRSIDQHSWIEMRTVSRKFSVHTFWLSNKGKFDDFPDSLVTDRRKLKRISFSLQQSRSFSAEILQFGISVAHHFWTFSRPFMCINMVLGSILIENNNNNKNMMKRYIWRDRENVLASQSRVIRKLKQKPVFWRQKMTNVFLARM